MSSTVFTPLVVGLSWVEATTNKDGSAIQPGELTGYSVGVRPDGSQQPVADPPAAYPQSMSVNGATTTTVSATAVLAALKLVPGNYWGTVQSLGPVPSGWTTEAPFSVPTPPPEPNPPSGFTVA